MQSFLFGIKQKTCEISSTGVNNVKMTFGRSFYWFHLDCSCHVDVLSRVKTLVYARRWAGVEPSMHAYNVISTSSVFADCQKNDSSFNDSFI